ncbi:unnamed protein product [Clonostachys byssicola]|uniref:Uncharacterized protein n=1 Tax=Clonostachys byssicola TaxID=160290 RepID=A0A9N9ULB6_9HYPO|nr:unnamed protein product [Clonostachys byssicola]
MSRNNHAELQFIPSSHPGAAPSRESQRRANAHAARVAHGRRNAKGENRPSWVEIPKVKAPEVYRGCYYSTSFADC